MDGCCAVATLPGRAVCPECKKKGRPVGMVTLEHLLVPEARERIPAGVAYSFCPTSDCDVVYYSAGAPTFHQRDLTVRVGLKVSQDPIPVCYCFGITEADIVEQIRQTGKSTVADAITAKVKAGECDCERRNPQGSCCLGNVAATTRRLLVGSRPVVGC